MPVYIPQKGDFISVTFDPQSGHEQKGRRPALVISNTLFNQGTGLALVCPVTNTNRNYPFHLPVPTKVSAVTGVVMVDQAKSIDFKTRKAKFIAKAPADLLEDALALLDAIVK